MNNGNKPPNNGNNGYITPHELELQKADLMINIWKEINTFSNRVLSLHLQHRQAIFSQMNAARTAPIPLQSMPMQPIPLQQIPSIQRRQNSSISVSTNTPNGHHAHNGGHGMNGHQSHHQPLNAMNSTMNSAASSSKSHEELIHSQLHSSHSSNSPSRNTPRPTPQTQPPHPVDGSMANSNSTSNSTSSKRDKSENPVNPRRESRESRDRHRHLHRRDDSSSDSDSSSGSGSATESEGSDSSDDLGYSASADTASNGANECSKPMVSSPAGCSPPSPSSSTRSSRRRRRGVARGKISGYNMFFGIRCKEIQKTKPNLEFASVSRNIALEWKKLTKSRQQHWKDVAVKMTEEREAEERETAKEKKEKRKRKKKKRAKKRRRSKRKRKLSEDADGDGDGDGRESHNDSPNSMVSNVRIEDSNSNNSNGHHPATEPPSKRLKVGVSDRNSTILNALRMPLMNGSRKLPLPQFNTQTGTNGATPNFALISEALKAMPMPPLQK